MLVGGNEAGKSTLIEATTLALTGRINGRSAQEELNPYWFNTSVVTDFLDRVQRGERPALPEIHLELFLEDRDDLQKLAGAINSAVPTMACPGVSMRIFPNPEYSAELAEWTKSKTTLLPVEYYSVEWRDFGDNKLTSRPKALATAVIDSRTVRSALGIDHHLRQILQDNLEPAEKASISLMYRNVKASMSDTALKPVNERIGKLHAALHDQPIALAMDQSSRTTWEGAVTPHVDAVPFSMSGQGQQAAIKISLAMNRHAASANFVMIEEPENHLSHTSLTTLLTRIENLAGDQQQIFITTHSSFVLNRLGLDALLLIGRGTTCRITELDPQTVAYFKKLPGYDTLRMALAEKIVLVEGPSDEIVFERVFRDTHGKRPMECGVDVLSMRGLSLARCLELCFALGKKVAALRDNDGIDPSELRKPVEKWLSNGKRELFIEPVAHGSTLEPQLIHYNGEAALRQILKLRKDTQVATWMRNDKTESALRIASTQSAIKAPQYMTAAAEFIYG
jgi:putative ATP-dependent endonuclease of OLD family